jgi:hypothetical protein
MVANAWSGSKQRGHGEGLPSVGEPETYCFSQTVVVLNGLPWSSVPFVVIVSTFPSLETTRLLVRITLPAFFAVDVVVFALTRLRAMVSSPPGAPTPETGASLPS